MGTAQCTENAKQEVANQALRKKGEKNFYFYRFSLQYELKQLKDLSRRRLSTII